MKTTVVLLFMCLALVYPYETNGQNALISLKMKNQTISDVLEIIEKQSNYFFFYNNKEVDVNRIVSVDVENMQLRDVLDMMFAGSKIQYSVLESSIILSNREILMSSSGIMQGISISGTVTDEYEEPMPGVNVVIKGTSTGVVTDVDGKYFITVPAEGTILVFSFIGYVTQEIRIEEQRSINISLVEDTREIEEIIVIGYGTARKSDLTGAVVRADLSALENSPNVNILQGLKGVVPGLNIGAITKAGDSPSVSIRGRNSISGTTTPLIVLDGIIYRGNLIDINPNDIESIDILKDASSAAIYGSQAANGVMLITTKTIRQMSKPVIEYNGSISFQSVMNKDMKRLDRDGFLQQLADIDIGNSRMGTDLLQKNPDFDVTKLFRDESVIQGYYNDTNVDWLDLMSESVPYIQNHNVNVRGKNELVSYFLSFGFSDQKNLIKNDTYKRYNLRVNLDAKITDWLKVGTQSFFTSSDLSGNNPSFANMCEFPALVASHDEDGNIIELPYRGTTSPLLVIRNPDVEMRYNLTGNFYGDISIPFVKGLNYRMNYSRNLTLNKRFVFDPYANALLGQAQKNNNSGYAWTLDNILSYQRDFGKHAINATVVYGVEKRGYESTDATANNFTNETLGYNYLAAAQSDLNTLVSNAWEESSLYAMGRVVYTFHNRYTATATIRRDGFSGFGENHKIGYFPSAALAWRISEENFLRNNIRWIDNLKLRASYGTNGNRTASRYSTLAQMSTQLPFSGRYSSVAGGYLFGDGATPELTQALKTMSNADLKWETTTSLNLGLDFSVLEGRLFGSYEFYNSKTSNLLYNIPIPNMNGMFPDSNGDLTIATNIGKLKNIGHELTLTGVPVRKNDLSWDITFNFSLNRNKVVSILGFDTDGDGKEDDLVSSKIFMDKPLSAIYDYNIIGMWQVDDYNKGIIPNGFTYGTYKVEDMNNDGNYTAENDRKILGYEDPLYYFSVQNILRYKGFELRIFINAVQGGSDHYYGRPLGSLPIPDGLSNSSHFKFDYWTPENPNAKYRQLGSYTATLGSSFSPYVQRNFIRLQEVSLSYRLPASILSKVPFNNARVYISGTNLFTITDWDGWDPEANLGVTYSLGGGYPTLKNVTIGLSFEF